VRILVDYRPALRHRTGVGEYVHESARALVASAPPGERLTLFSSSWKDRLAPDVIPGARVVDRAWPVRALNFAWHRLRWPPVDLLAGGRFDVVQSSHPLLMPAAAAQLVTIYDLDFLDHPERSPREIRRDYPVLAAAHARRADQIIAISEHTAREVVARLGVPRSQVTVCVPGAPAWPARSAEPGPEGCILFLGSIEPRKNLGVLLDAYEQLIARGGPVPRLVLAGALSSASETLVARVQREPLAGHVDLPGYIDPQARQALYRRALVFVMPSHTEGFGLPAVEAMVVGVPVIAANRGALPEAVGEAGILVDPDDAGALSAALHDVLEDRARREKMTEAGWRQARRFSWSTTAQGMREAWAVALEHRKARRG
jgi:glycosyltransferase involved in cell wall biosynthesis